MKRLFLAGVAAIALSACAVNGEKGISPAEGALTGCEAYTMALNKAAEANRQGLLTQGMREVIDTTVPSAVAFCTGNPPDVDAKIIDVAVSGATTTILTILAQIGMR